MSKKRNVPKGLEERKITKEHTLRKVCEIVIDDSPECPCEWGGWIVYDFNPRHIKREGVEKWFEEDEETGRKRLNKEFRELEKKGLAYVLSYFEHGLCRWSLGPATDPWDSTPGAGILVWEDKEEDIGSKTPEARREDAKNFLERYTDWCNGNCYGFRLRWEDEDEVEHEDIDSCYGAIGDDDLKASLKELWYSHGPFIITSDFGIEQYIHTDGWKTKEQKEKEKNDGKC